MPEKPTLTVSTENGFSSLFLLGKQIGEATRRKQWSITNQTHRESIKQGRIPKGPHRMDKIVHGLGLQTISEGTSNPSLQSCCIILHLINLTKELSNCCQKEPQHLYVAPLPWGYVITTDHKDEIPFTCDNVFNGAIFSLVHMSVIFDLSPS